MHWVASVAVVIFLLGSLLPPIGSVSSALVATPVVAALTLIGLLGPKKSPRLTILVAGALFAVLILNAVLGPDPLTLYGQDKFARLYTSTLLSALAAAVIFNVDRFTTLAKTWVVVTAILAVLTLFAGSAFSLNRSTLFDNNPIWLARALASGALLALALPRLGASRRWMMAAAPLTVALIATGSRGPAVGLVVGILILYVRSVPRLAASIGLGIATYAAFLTVPSLRRTRIGEMLDDSTGTPFGAVTRSEMWENAFRTWRENTDGVGLGNWTLYSTVRHDWPHNIWLESAAELGTVAAACLVLLTVYVIVKSTKTRGAGYSRILIAILSAEIVAVSVSGDLNARTFFFLLFLALHATFWPSSQQGEETRQAEDPVTGQSSADHLTSERPIAAVPGRGTA